MSNSREFLVKNGLKSLEQITSVNLSGQPNALIIVDNNGTFTTSPHTTATISGAIIDISNNYFLLGSISGSLYSTVHQTSASLDSTIQQLSASDAVIYSNIRDISGDLQTQINTNLYSLTSISGNLQIQITQNLSELYSLSGSVSNNLLTLSAISGNLQTQISTNLSTLSDISGNLQAQATINSSRITQLSGSVAFLNKTNTFTGSNTFTDGVNLVSISPNGTVRVSHLLWAESISGSTLKIRPKSDIPAATIQGYGTSNILTLLNSSEEKVFDVNHLGIPTLYTDTNSVSISSGAMVISGGLGISRDVHIGGEIYSPTITTLQTASNIYAQNYTTLVATSGILKNEIDTNYSTLIATSGILQTQIADLIAISGILQNQITDNYSTLIATSGILQTQITDNYSTLIATSGTLQTQITDNYSTLIATSGILQNEYNLFYGMETSFDIVSTSGNLSSYYRVVEQISGGITSYLWSTPTSGDRVTIKNTSNSINYIDGNGYNIEGQTAWSINSGESITFLYNNTQWIVIGRGDMSEMIEQWVIPPMAYNSTGVKGTIAFDGIYRYECVGTDTWIRWVVQTSF